MNGKLLDVFECGKQEYGPETTFVKCGKCPGFEAKNQKVDLQPSPAPATAPPGAVDVKSTRNLILRNHLSPGDVLVMTAAIRSLHVAHKGKYRIAVNTTCNAVFENSPDVEPLEQARSEGWEVVQTHYPAIGQSNQRAIHFMQAYCEFLEDSLGVCVPLAVNRPQVFISDLEKSWITQVHEMVGKPTQFWLVNAGYKTDFPAKFWGSENYQRVVDLLRGRVVFVQVGKEEASHRHAPLRNVVNLVGQTDDRQLIRLANHADGILCGVTYLQHLAAAMEKPSVVVMGGREPVLWNSYPLQHLMHTVGGLPCCKSGGCWKSRVVSLPDGDKEKNGSLCEFPLPGEEPIGKCMGLIKPEEVAGKILSISP